MVEELMKTYEDVRKGIVDFLTETITQRKSEGAVIGLSGGVDSAVTAYLLQETELPLQTVYLRCPYLTSNSEKDACQVNESLEARAKDNGLPKPEFRVIDTSRMIQSAEEALGKPESACEKLSLLERTATTTLCQIADRENYSIISSTNKTEYLTSYFSLGGHVASVFPLAGLYKTQVQELAGHIGVPQWVIDKEPSADITGISSDEEDIGMPYVVADYLLSKLEENDWKIPSQLDVENVRHKMRVLISRKEDADRKLSFPEVSLELPEIPRPEYLEHRSSPSIRDTYIGG